MAIKPGKQSKVPKQARKNLPQIKRNIEGASTYFKENVVHYNELMNFVYNTTVNQTDKDALKAMDKPVIEFNIVEAFISRLLGEFAKQEPSAEVRGCNDSVSPQLVEFIESFMRGFLKDAKSRQTLYNVYKSCLGGGYGIFKIYTEYEHNKSFNQVIKVKAHPHPTRVFFDPDAKNPSKDDGKYCFESYVKTKEEVEEMAPNIDLSKIDYYPDIEGVQWYFADKDEKKHIVVFDYYEKKRVKRTAHLLADGSVMNSAEFTKYKAEFSGIEQPLESKETRTYYDTIIVRYRLIGDEIISYEETDYDYFP
jgi:hypothetical protein